MRYGAAIMAILMIALMPTCGWAADPKRIKTGMDLLSLCSTDDFDSQLLCVVYISGLSAGLKIGLVSAAGGTYSCRQKGATVGQELLIIMKWMRENPRYLNEEASTVAAAALLDVSRCKPKQQ